MVKRRVVIVLLALAGLGVWIGRAASPLHLEAVLPARPVTLAPGKILVVLSSAEWQSLCDGSRRKTGTFLGEFYEPYVALRNHGYEVVTATATGAPAAIDPESLEEKYWDDPVVLERACRFAERSPAVRAPIRLTEALAAADSYQGIVVPGGQGMMVDLLDNAEVHALLAHFAARDQPVGLICHAPALLLGGDLRLRRLLIVIVIHRLARGR